MTDQKALPSMITVDEAFKRGLIAHETGNLQGAESYYRAVLAVVPMHPHVNYRLGVLAQSVGAVRDALLLFRVALRGLPDSTPVWTSYIEALIYLGELPLARRARRVALSFGVSVQGLDALGCEDMSSDQVETESFAEIVGGGLPPSHWVKSLEEHYASGHWDLAAKGAALMVDEFPASPVGWRIAGCLHYQRGALEAALPFFEKGVELTPEDAGAHSNLGAILKDLGRLEDAKNACLRALRLNPRSAEAAYNLANTLRDLGDAGSSIDYYRLALRLNPAFAEAHLNLGVALHALGHRGEAADHYRAAHRLDPNQVDASFNLGNLLLEAGDASEAIACYRIALQGAPDRADIHGNLGTALRDRGDLDAAAAAYQRAVALAPQNLFLHSNYLFLLSSRALTAPNVYLDAARAFGRLASAAAHPKFCPVLSSFQPKRLKVGFVSGDFRNHPVGYFLESLVRAVDPERLELIGFSTQQEEDDLTARLRGRLASWIPLPGLSDRQAAAIVHEVAPDILVDLAGHTANNRLGIFAYRPAAIQMSWLGYWASTGLAEMDYVLGDDIILPPSEASHLCETPWRLSSSFLCFDPPQDQVPIAPLPALQGRGLTFGCFNHLSKMGDSVIMLWARILRSINQSRLFLKSRALDDQHVQIRIKERFQAEGIEADRLILEGFTTRLSYLEAYHRVDLALDPFPYHGGTTTVEALWMGVPVLTLKGDRLISHVGESLLQHAGLSDWVAKDPEAYLAKALTFAGDLEALARLRLSLREQLMISPLMDSAAFARNFEAALREIWDNAKLRAESGR